MKNNVVQFVLRMVVTFIAYGFCLWLYDVIFHKEYGIDGGLIFQSVLFSIFWAIYLTWTEKKK